MTSPRIVVRGATLAVSRRTNFRKAFLAPWHPLVDECWRYSLALAQHATGVALHLASRVITHHHLDLTPREPNFGDFSRRFHHDTSCSINTLMAAERYDAPRQLFDDRPTHAMRCLDASAQASQLTYDYVNCVAAGLVERPEDMPGTVLDFGHWKSGGIAVKRPDIFFGPERPAEIELLLTPPPLLMQAFDCDLEALVHHMRRLSEDALRAIRDARRGRAPMGAEKVSRIHPWDEPKTMREPGGQLVPEFKMGARDFAGRRTACDAGRDVTRFRVGHEGSRIVRLNGADPEFPYGTYGMRVFHDVPIAEPLDDAIVTAPGPLLEEVLEGARKRDEARPPEARDEARSCEARIHVDDEVRAAWSEEAAEVTAIEELEFDLDARKRRPPRSGASTTPTAVIDASLAATDATRDADADAAHSAAAPGARPDPELRHRFDPKPDRPPELHARRIITRRDRRRSCARKPRGSDPPA